MLIITLSEEEFRWLKKKNKLEKWAAIRIYNASENPLYLSHDFNNQFEDILVTKFSDVLEEITVEGEKFTPFNRKNLAEILDFVEKNKSCDKLFIHCHAGMYRSPGLAVGLSLKLEGVNIQHGLDGKSEVYPYPNVITWFE